MKKIIVLTLSIIFCGCSNQQNDISIPDTTSLEEKIIPISGAYDLTLTKHEQPSRHSANESCSVVVCKISCIDRDCNENEQKSADGMNPSKRLYLTDQGKNTVSLGLDDKCVGKLFERSVFAHCENKNADGSLEESTRYEFNVEKDGTIHGKIRYCDFHLRSPSYHLYVVHTYEINGQKI